MNLAGPWLKLLAAGVLFASGLYVGKYWVQAQWDADQLAQAQAVDRQSSTVLKSERLQRTRADTAEILNDALQTKYRGTADALAGSVRAYAAAHRCRPVSGTVADPGKGEDRLAPGPEDREAAELAGLTQDASAACLASYGELKLIWDTAPPARSP